MAELKKLILLTVHAMNDGDGVVVRDLHRMLNLIAVHFGLPSATHIPKGFVSQHREAIVDFIRVPELTQAD